MKSFKKNLETVFRTRYIRKMKKYTALLLLVMMLINFSLYAKKLAPLPEVLSPYKIAIKNKKLIISDHKVLLHMYSMDDFTYKLLSKKGEGPSESRIVQDFWLYKNRIFSYGAKKGMYFSYDGKYINELKIVVPGLNRACPVEENFLIYNNSNIRKKNHVSKEMSIYLYSKENGFKYKKLFYFFEKQYGKTHGKPNYPLIKNYFGFIVEDGKVFVGDTYRGFSVEIFDREGKEAGKIRLYPERIKIPEAYINTSLKRLEKDPAYQAFSNMYYTYFPDYFPDFYRFDVEDGKVYFLTYKKIDGRREMIVTDFYGKILKRSSVPWIEDYNVHIYFAIQNEKYYYIIENQDTEEWELHVEDIK